jgi:hypothetical protein
MSKKEQKKFLKIRHVLKLKRLLKNKNFKL